MSGLTWTNEDIDFLKTNYSNHTAMQIGKMIGRTRESVMVKAGKLGLYKSFNAPAEDDAILDPSVFSAQIVRQMVVGAIESRSF